MDRYNVEVPTVEGIRWTGPTLTLDFIASTYIVWEEPAVTQINPREAAVSA